MKTFKKEPVAWVGLLIALTLGVINNDKLWILFEGKVTATIASRKDNFGRCIDSEILIINGSKNTSTNIVISFDVDHFTRQGAIEIVYGDEKEMLISSGIKTLLKRKKYYYVEHYIDYQQSKIIIPKLNPKEYLNLYFSGEAIKDPEMAEARQRLLIKKEISLMNKPQVLSITRDNGDVKIIRKHRCGI